MSQLIEADSQHLYEKTVDDCSVYRSNSYEHRCRFARERGITISEAYDALGSAMRGEYEGDAAALQASIASTEAE